MKHEAASYYAAFKLKIDEHANKMTTAPGDRISIQRPSRSMLRKVSEVALSLDLRAFRALLLLMLRYQLAWARPRRCATDRSHLGKFLK